MQISNLWHTKTTIFQQNYVHTWSPLHNFKNKRAKVNSVDHSSNSIPARDVISLSISKIFPLKACCTHNVTKRESVVSTKTNCNQLSKERKTCIESREIMQGNVFVKRRQKTLKIIKDMLCSNSVQNTCETRKILLKKP